MPPVCPDRAGVQSTARRQERHLLPSHFFSQKKWEGNKLIPNPQTTTNMLSLIPKMGKLTAGCAKRPLFPAESGNKLIPNPQTTTNMLSLIPKMGKRTAGCAKRPLFPAESGNKLISDRGSEVLWRGYGEAPRRLRRDFCPISGNGPGGWR